MWGFAAPALVVYVTFVLVPVALAAVYSFFNWNGLGDLDRFIGLENYAGALGDPTFLGAMANNGLIVVLSLIVQGPLAIAIALLLNRKLRGRALIRTLIFVPYVLSEVVAGLAFRLLLPPGGPLDGVLTALGWTGDKPLWLGDPDVAFWTLSAVLTWKYLGFAIILMLAGLQGVPEELSEAAAIDGATWWQTQRHITLPLLGPTIRIWAFLSVIGSLQLFDMVWILTGGGPVNATETMATYMVEYGNGRSQIGYGSLLRHHPLPRLPRRRATLPALRLAPRSRRRRHRELVADDRLDLPPREPASCWRSRQPRRTAARDPLEPTVAYLIALVVCGITVAPVVYVILGGFRTTAQINRDPGGLPDPWVRNKYLAVFGNANFWTQFGNSTIVAVATTAGVVVLGVMAAFVIARYEFRGRGFLFAFFTAGLLFPLHGRRAAAVHDAEDLRAPRQPTRGHRPADRLRAPRDDHHPRPVPARDPRRARGRRRDRRRRPLRLLPPRAPAALLARSRDGRRARLRGELERVPAAAPPARQSRDGDAPGRRAVLLHGVLAGHRRRARLHLARDGPGAPLLHARPAPHRGRPDGGGEGMTRHSTLPASTAGVPPWRDRRLGPAARVDALLEVITLREKIAQLYGVWVGAGADGGDVAPHQHDLEGVATSTNCCPTGFYSSRAPSAQRPSTQGRGRCRLRRRARIVAASRFGIPALAHEECLAGFAAWGATAYPVPLSWGASFDPELVEQMARRIGDDMRSVNIDQGLAPVLDVVRDARWGRVEETIGEDPYLVGSVGRATCAASSRLASSRPSSTSSATRPREPAAISRPSRSGRASSPTCSCRPSRWRSAKEARDVMRTRTPTSMVSERAADRSLLTELLRDKWGFTGTVVADYFAIAFLHLLHGVAGTWAEAAGAALEAGIDVELPTVKTFGDPLVRAVEAGAIDVALIDTAARRVLAQKLDLGLLDDDYDPSPRALEDSAEDTVDAVRGTIDLDPPGNRDLARRLAEESVVLVRNAGVLPLAAPASIAVIGPNADEPYSMLGCYSFPTHVVTQHPGTAMGIRIDTVLDALREEYPTATVSHATGTGVDDGATEGIADAVAAAEAAEVAIVVLGDRAGLFGRGTSGEGCDAADLSLPGTQQQLLDAVLDTGTPTVLVLLAGRPYALGSAPARAAAIVPDLLPGEEGCGDRRSAEWSCRADRATAREHPRPFGRAALHLPRGASRSRGDSDIDPTAAFPFGHGLGYAGVEWAEFSCVDAEVDVDGEATLALTLVNGSERDAVEVVQFYLHRDPVASVVRPVQRLIGYRRVAVPAGSSIRVSAAVPMDLMAFTGRNGANRGAGGDAGSGGRPLEREHPLEREGSRDGRDSPGRSRPSTAPSHRGADRVVSGPVAASRWRAARSNRARRGSSRGPCAVSGRRPRAGPTPPRARAWPLRRPSAAAAGGPS